MKVILIGAGGTIGQSVKKALEPRHEVIAVGRKSGDFQVDMSDKDALKAFFSQEAPFDALISTAGEVSFGRLEQMTEKLFMKGIQQKLLGQVNMVTEGIPFMRNGGSFTLTSGILSQDPIVGGTSASMVNGALEAFTKAAAIELPRGLRINVVCPTLLTESATAYGPFFQGFETVPASRVALAYIKSCEGHQTGQVYKVF